MFMLLVPVATLIIVIATLIIVGVCCGFTGVYSLVSVATLIIVGVTLIIVEVCFGFYYYKNPFLPRPERVFAIDISGRRNVEYLSLVDDWINTHAESITAICADLAADTKTWYELYYAASSQTSI